MDDNWGYPHDFGNLHMLYHKWNSWIDESNSGKTIQATVQLDIKAQHVIEASQAMAGLEKSCDKYG